MMLKNTRVTDRHAASKTWYKEKVYACAVNGISLMLYIEKNP